MKYLTSEEVAEKKGLSIRRIQQMCRDGGFDGAFKEGKSWLIPDDVLEYSLTVKDYFLLDFPTLKELVTVIIMLIKPYSLEIS